MSQFKVSDFKNNDAGDRTLDEDIFTVLCMNIIKERRAWKKKEVVK